MPTPVTVVWGPTGAPGRTTVAVTLAAQLAAGGVRTLLVDLDTWGACVAQVLGMVDEAPGVAAAARASEQGGLDVPALARLAPEVVPAAPGAHRAAAGRPLARAARRGRRGRAPPGALGRRPRRRRHRLRRRGRRGAELRHRGAAPQRQHPRGPRGRRPARRRRCRRPGRAATAGARRPGGGPAPSPPPLVVVNKTRTSAAGARPERSIGEVLRRFAGLEATRFLPWSPQECDEALLAGRALTETHPRAALTVAVGDLAAELDPRVAPVVRAGRRAGRRRRGGGDGSARASRSRAASAAAPSGR